MAKKLPYIEKIFKKNRNIVTIIHVSIYKLIK